MNAKKHSSIDKVTELVVNECIQPSANEKMLIISDEDRKRIAQNIFDKACEKCNPILILTKGETPRIALQSSGDADIIVLLTNESLETNPLILKARRDGARIINMTGVSEEVYKRAVAVDYKMLSQQTNFVAKKLEGAKEVRITSPNGTNLKFSINHKPIIRSDGHARKMRELIHLPDGEVIVAPVENSAEGVIIADKSVSGYGLLAKPVELHVRNGRAFVYSTDLESHRVSELIDEYGPCASVVGKIGIGTNPKAEIRGTSEDTKKIGVVSIGLGENKMYGGTNSCGIRLDFVIDKPTVIVDGRRILVNGELDISSLYK